MDNTTFQTDKVFDIHNPNHQLSAIIQLYVSILQKANHSPIKISVSHRVYSVGSKRNQLRDDTNITITSNDITIAIRYDSFGYITIITSAEL